MHLFIFFIGLLCFVQIRTNEQQSETLWNQFKDIHNKKYNNIREEIYRRNVFEKNLMMINQHNIESDMGLHSYTLKMNYFGDMTHEEIVQTMTSRSKMSLNQEKSNEYFASSNLAIPDAVDWRKKGAVGIIEAQGACASDWAFATTASLEGQHFLKTGKLIRLSAQNLMDCSDKFGNEGCNGGLVDAAYQYIKVNKGIDTEATYPYETSQGKCRFNPANIGATDTGFVKIPRGNETALQIAIANVGPIAVAIDSTHASFMFYSSGVYDEPLCSSTELAHAVTVVGYDTFNNGTVKKDYYIVKNSWGEDFGMKGYIWMSRNKNNQCGIATRASYPLV